MSSQIKYTFRYVKIKINIFVFFVFHIANEFIQNLHRDHVRRNFLQLQNYLKNYQFRGQYFFSTYHQVRSPNYIVRVGGEKKYFYKKVFRISHFLICLLTRVLFHQCQKNLITLNYDKLTFYHIVPRQIRIQEKWIQ